MDLGKTRNAQEFPFPGLIGRSSLALKRNLVGALLIVTTSSALTLELSSGEARQLERIVMPQVASSSQALPRNDGW